MPLLTADRPPAVADVRPLWGDELCAVAQGLEGRQVHDRMIDVSRHWEARTPDRLQPAADDVVDLTQSELLDCLQDCRPAPFEVVGKVQARFTRIVDLQPLPVDYPFDAEDE